MGEDGFGLKSEREGWGGGKGEMWGERLQEKIRRREAIRGREDFAIASFPC